MDERHLKIKKHLRIFGIVLLIIGVSLDIYGAIDFFSHFKNMSMPENPWILFISFPLTAIGLILIISGNIKEISNYTSKELGSAISHVSKNIKDGLSEQTLCPHCGSYNDLDASFCNKCGKPLKKICKHCLEENPCDSKYCNHCGKEL